MTENTPLTFGAHKGTPLRACPDSYLQWMATNLLDGDFSEWGQLAKRLLEARAKENKKVGNLEDQANEILKQAGYGNLTSLSSTRRGYGKPIRRY